MTPPSAGGAPSGRHASAVLVFLGAAFLGVSVPASKLLLPYFSPFHLVGLFGLGSALGTLPLLVPGGTPGAPWRLPRPSAWRLLGGLLSGGFLAPLLLLSAVQRVAAATVSIWLGIELAATVLLGALLFGERSSPASRLAAAGSLLAASALLLSGGSRSVGAGALVGLACAFRALDNHLSTPLEGGLDPARVTLWRGLLVALGSLMVGGLSRPVDVPALPLAGALVLGAACGASSVLYLSVARWAGVTRGQALLAAAPFWGLLFSTQLLGERLSGLHQLAAVVLMLSYSLLGKGSWDRRALEIGSAPSS